MPEAPMETKSKSRRLAQRASLDSLWVQMDTERSSFRNHWRDLSDFVLPRHMRPQPAGAAVFVYALFVVSIAGARCVNCGMRALSGCVAASDTLAYSCRPFGAI